MFVGSAFRRTGLLDQRKYPASPLFLLMALGPEMARLPLAERPRGASGCLVAVFACVPFFE